MAIIDGLDDLASTELHFELIAEFLTDKVVCCVSDLLALVLHKGHDVVVHIRNVSSAEGEELAYCRDNLSTYQWLPSPQLQAVPALDDAVYHPKYVFERSRLVLVLAVLLLLEPVFLAGL